MSKREKSEGGALIYGGIPRANLMPPEVAQRRRESTRRRSLIALSGLVVAIVIGGVVASFLYAAAAEQRRAFGHRMQLLRRRQVLEPEVLEARRIDQRTIGSMAAQLMYNTCTQPACMTPAAAASIEPWDPDKPTLESTGR